MAPYSNVEKSPSSNPKRTAPPRSRLPSHILLIEDDEVFAQAFTLALEQEGVSDVLVAADEFEAGNMMSQHPFGLVITDWRLPLATGFSALRKAEHSLSIDPEAPAEWFSSKKIPVIVVTACSKEEVEREKRLKGVFQFLGVVSKEQNMEGILDKIHDLYAKKPLTTA
jgi:CheY-like chemotaxis protein